MSSLLKNYINREYFDSYEDFYENFKISYPDTYNFAYDVVDKYAETEEDKLAMIWIDDTDEEHQFTFKDISVQSQKTANYFKKIGVKKGDTVLVTLKNRYEFWFTIIALHRIGAIIIPATHMLKPHDIVYRVEQANSKTIITYDGEKLPEIYEEAEAEMGIKLHKILVGSSREGWDNFHESIENESEVFPRPTGDEATTAEELSAIYFSSGTSGMPKMVSHTHAYSLGHIITAKYWQGVVENGLHCTVADTGWAKAVWGSLYGQWLSGCAVFVYDYTRFNPKKMLEHMSHYKLTTFCGPPTVYRFLIREDLSKYNLSSIQEVVTAGEPLNTAVFYKIKEALGLEVREGFGQTETIISCCNFKFNQTDLGSIGTPSPGYHISLLDKECEPVDVGEEGEICIDISEKYPWGLFVGYHNNPEKTNAACHDGFYHTGDTGWIDENKHYHFIGRTDDLIKSSGYRIGPFEVENSVVGHPAAVECAVTAYPDEIRGEIVKATIVLAEGYEPSDELIKDIQNHVKNDTAPYKYPRRIEFVEELPKTPNGKIQHGVIRNKDLELLNRK